jgi:DMSO/TMAO reductase YedYZ molybdopterin-dependent catalytic subunit
MDHATAMRLPPGQRLVKNLPVLHAGRLMKVDPAEWTCDVTGLVEPGLSIDLNGLQALPPTEQVSDIHCVTDWTMLDTHWKGVRVKDLLAGQTIKPEARHVVVQAYGDWTTNLPVEELLRDDVLLAYEYEGRPLSAEHGGPVRLLVPRLYFWKSAKWVHGIEFTADQRLGFWEVRGYHPLGDPWLEQRYS